MSSAQADTYNRIAKEYEESAGQEFRLASDLAAAVRVLFWFKEHGDIKRNISRRPPLSVDAIQKRKALLEVAHKVLEAEYNEVLQSFHRRAGLVEHYNKLANGTTTGGED